MKRSAVIAGATALATVLAGTATATAVASHRTHAAVAQASRPAAKTAAKVDVSTFATQPVVLTGADFPAWSGGPELTARVPQPPNYYGVVNTQGYLAAAASQRLLPGKPQARCERLRGPLPQRPQLLPAQPAAGAHAARRRPDRKPSRLRVDREAVRSDPIPGRPDVEPLHLEQRVGLRRLLGHRRVPDLQVRLRAVPRIQQPAAPRALQGGQGVGHARLHPAGTPPASAGGNRVPREGTRRHARPDTRPQRRADQQRPAVVHGPRRGGSRALVREAPPRHRRRQPGADRRPVDGQDALRVCDAVRGAGQIMGRADALHGAQLAVRSLHPRRRRQHSGLFAELVRRLRKRALRPGLHAGRSGRHRSGLPLQHPPRRRAGP